MTIEKANSSDSTILTAITKASKAYWGYSNEQIINWANALTITKAYIETNAVYNLKVNNSIIGYYSYLIQNETTIILDNLFILPEFIGKGFGDFLMNDFLTRIKDFGFKKVTLDSEPNAEKFYAKYGFIKTGERETSIKNRFLPIMELEIG